MATSWLTASSSASSATAVRTVARVASIDAMIWAIVASDCWNPADSGGFVALGGGVGVVLRVLDDLVEQLVHCLEVGAANVPVRLLAVDGEGGEVDDHRAEELGDTRDDVGVDGTLGNGLYFGHGDSFSDANERRLGMVQRYSAPYIPQASEGNAQ
jgi:hypothetical protein